MLDLSQEDWATQLENDPKAQIIDVRTNDEVSQGMILGAVQLDLYKGQAFIEALEKLDKTQHYYVYCRSGGRSAQACSIMNQMGFESTYNLIGGYQKWTGEVTA
jgi:rhodanese-related sulfurtransferase